MNTHYVGGIMYVVRTVESGNSKLGFDRTFFFTKQRQAVHRSEVNEKLENRQADIMYVQEVVAHFI